MKTYEVKAYITVEADSIEEAEDIVANTIYLNNEDHADRYMVIEGVQAEERNEG